MSPEPHEREDEVEVDVDLALRRWREDLEREVEGPIEVVFGRSRTAPVQARPGAGPGDAAFRVRLHRVFASAPEEVRWAVGRWLRSGRRARRASEVLGTWMEAALRELDRAQPSPRSPLGECHDLEPILAEVLGRELSGAFADREPPGITWGRRARSRTRRSLRLGSYLLDEHLIRVHPVLDQTAVPEWFVRHIVFHEALHALLPPVRSTGGRWVHHGPEFRRREEAHPDYGRAVAWQERNLPRLMRSARTGRAMRGTGETGETGRDSDSGTGPRQLEFF